MNPRPADYESAALPLSYLGAAQSYVSISQKSGQLTAISVVPQIRTNGNSRRVSCSDSLFSAGLPASSLCPEPESQAICARRG